MFTIRYTDANGNCPSPLFDTMTPGATVAAEMGTIVPEVALQPRTLDGGESGDEATTSDTATNTMGSQTSDDSRKISSDSRTSSLDSRTGLHSQGQGHGQGQGDGSSATSDDDMAAVDGSRFMVRSLSENWYNGELTADNTDFIQSRQPFCRVPNDVVQ